MKGTFDEWSPSSLLWQLCRPPWGKSWGFPIWGREGKEFEALLELSGEKKELWGFGAHCEGGCHGHVLLETTR